VEGFHGYFDVRPVRFSKLDRSGTVKLPLPFDAFTFEVLKTSKVG